MSSRADYGTKNAAILVIALFIGAMLQLRVIAPLVAILFIGCMLCVIAALVLFIWDINLALRALKLDVGARLGGLRTAPGGHGSDPAGAQPQSSVLSTASTARRTAS